MIFTILSIILDVILVVLFFATRSAIRTLHYSYKCLSMRFNKYDKKGE